MSEAAAAGAAKPAKTVPAAAAAVPLRASQVRKISLERFQVVGHFRARYEAVLPAGWDFEDALVPEFWGYMAPRMQGNPSSSQKDHVGAVIELFADDHSFFAMLLVTGLKHNAQGVANALEVRCIGPASDAKTGKAWAVDTKTGLAWRGRSVPQAS